MRLAQGIIKFFALCLAGVIIVGMFAAVISAITLVGRLVDGDFGGGEGEIIWSNEGPGRAEITRLEIKTGATNVSLVSDGMGDFSVDTNNKYVSTRVVGNTLYVEEESQFVFSGWFDSGKTTIYVPTTASLKEVKIEAGAGSFEADKIVAETVEFNLGAGKTKIQELIATENARVEGGAGMMEINGGEVRNLRMNLGAGKAWIKAKLDGNCKVESGVGRLDLVLVGGKSRYKFSVDKGIGSVMIDGTSQGDDAVYGSGDNAIALESGVGAVEVVFADK